ncbi:Methyltransferase-like protein 22 [Podila humilis]|nr:Methyltransferase-like protein 22 [Podila humilis]
MQDQDQDQDQDQRDQNQQDRPSKRPRCDSHLQHKEMDIHYLRPVAGTSSSDLRPMVARDTTEADQIQRHAEEESTRELSDDEDIVLSDVHIHPDNGRVDGRSMTSSFYLTTRNQDVVHIATESINSSEEHPEHDAEWEYEIHIQHAMGTSLRNVGSQVWMGCFLLIDYMMELDPLLRGSTVLEIGAGTGISSIACAKMTGTKKIFCTDFDTAILSNCKHNIDTNNLATEQAVTNIATRRLNWFLPRPMETMDDEEPDEFSWTARDIQEWKQEGAFIFGADVVYDDSLTDALVECLERLLPVSLPLNHPRYTHGRMAIITMEKRYNFSLNALDVVAQAHDYFVQRMGRSSLLQLRRLDATMIGRFCEYERGKDLELFQVTCRSSPGRAE